MTRRASVLGLLAAAMLSACTPNPNGQGVTDTGTVVGTIVDAAHPTQPVQTAVIQIGLQTMRLGPADNGKFVLAGVPTGTQQLTISSPGFTTYPASVVVRKDQTSDLGVIALASQAP